MGGIFPFCKQLTESRVKPPASPEAGLCPSFPTGAAPLDPQGAGYASSIGLVGALRPRAPLGWSRLR